MKGKPTLILAIIWGVAAIILAVFFVDEYRFPYFLAGVLIIAGLRVRARFKKIKQIHKKTAAQIMLGLITISIFLMFPISERTVDFQEKHYRAKLKVENLYLEYNQAKLEAENLENLGYLENAIKVREKVEDLKNEIKVWENAKDTQLKRMKFSIGAAIINGLCILFAIASLLHFYKIGTFETLKFEIVYCVYLLFCSSAFLIWAIWGFQILPI